MVDTTKAKEQFDEALKKASKIKFYDYGWNGTLREKRVAVKPEAIEICDSRNCDAGSNCCHQFKMKGITLCVY